MFDGLVTARPQLIVGYLDDVLHVLEKSKFTGSEGWLVRRVLKQRILFSNHSRWGFFNQFGEFSSLAKFVGGSQEVASPFGSAASYVRTYRIHSL